MVGEYLRVIAIQRNVDTLGPATKSVFRPDYELIYLIVQVFYYSVIRDSIFAQMYYACAHPILQCTHTHKASRSHTKHVVVIIDWSHPSFDLFAVR